MWKFFCHVLTTVTKLNIRLTIESQRIVKTVKNIYSNASIAFKGLAITALFPFTAIGRSIKIGYSTIA